MRDKVIKELRKLGASECEAQTMANKYPKTIAHADDMGSLPYYPAFQIARAEQGQSADIED